MASKEKAKTITKKDNITWGLHASASAKRSTHDVKKVYVVKISTNRAVEKVTGFANTKCNGADFKWEKKLLALQKWLKQGRKGKKEFPTRNAHGKTERSLAMWMHNQRLRYKSGKLPVQRARRLESIPNWAWNDHESSWSTSFNSSKMRLSQRRGYPSQYAEEIDE